MTAPAPVPHSLIPHSLAPQSAAPLVLVTGATGFVAAALIPELQRQGWQVRAAARQGGEELCRRFPGIQSISSPDLSPRADWRAAVAGCQAVIHLAARVHVMQDTADDPLQAFRHANRDGTATLARQAAQAGVRRFVLASTIKVNGEQTAPGRPFRAEDPAAPQDPYGQSKAEAEQALWQCCQEAPVPGTPAMEGVVIRPPLVYGPGVKGNLATLLDKARRGWPLPLGGIHNARSLVFVGSLASALVLCARHPAAAGQTFLIRDGEDLSTSALCRHLFHLCGRRPRLVPAPPRWLLAAMGKGEVARRLYGNLQVDDTPLRQLCGWQPVASVSEGLRQMVQMAAGDQA